MTSSLVNITHDNNIQQKNSQQTSLNQSSNSSRSNSIPNGNLVPQGYSLMNQQQQQNSSDQSQHQHLQQQANNQQQIPTDLNSLSYSKQHQKFKDDLAKQTQSSPSTAQVQSQQQPQNNFIPQSMTNSLPPAAGTKLLGLQSANQISNSISNLDMIINPKDNIDGQFNLQQQNTQAYQQQQQQQTSPKQQQPNPSSSTSGTNANNIAQPASNTSSTSTILDQTTATIRDELMSSDGANDMDSEDPKSK